MTLTVIVGSSGSGKTTFLSDLYQRRCDQNNKCIYLRQYHSLRPYIKVCHIPNFDPTQLPYWSVYQQEGTADIIKVGGSMAGKTVGGGALSGGQRKLLMVELLCQRITAAQTTTSSQQRQEYLILLDEPFAGVTDNHVDYIQERLNFLRHEQHNVIVVTNDHVELLTNMADNVITVSAINRTKVQINEATTLVDRSLTLATLASVGDRFIYRYAAADGRFFWNTEVYGNGTLMGVIAFAIVAFSMYLAAFWNSSQENVALVLIAGNITSYISIQPFLVSLVDWRNAMLEEAEALVHASKGRNKVMKLCLAITLLFMLSGMKFLVVNSILDGLHESKIWMAMFFDTFSLSFVFLWPGIFTRLSSTTTSLLGGLSFLMMYFCSTAYSPGAGMDGIKVLRYLFPRFYYWCLVPGLQDDMEGCPGQDEILYALAFSGLLGLIIFVLVKASMAVVRMLCCQTHRSGQYYRTESRTYENDHAFVALQQDLFTGGTIKGRLTATPTAPDLSKTSDHSSSSGSSTRRSVT